MSFVPPPSEIREMMAKAPADALNLGIGEPGFPTPPALLAYVKEHLQNWPLGYTSNAGLLELREQIAGNSDSNLTAARVCITNGAQEALYAACHTLLSRGDEALVPNPGFLAYPNLVKMTGAMPVDYSMPCTPGEPFDFDAFKNKISGRIKVLFLNSPSNPTGFCFSLKELKEITALCERCGITIISDEVYRELYFGQHQPPGILAVSDNHFQITSLSKTFSMTGWRLGWAAGPQNRMAEFTRVHQYLTTCASALSQHAALCLFDDALKDVVKTFRISLKQRRDFLFNFLNEKPAWRVAKPEAGLFLFAGLPDWPEQKSSPAEHLLHQHNIISVPGDAFGSRGKGYLRLSFAAEIDIIKDACHRLTDFQPTVLF